jgi:TolA-binding protein
LVAQYSSRGELELNPGMELNPDIDNIIFKPITEEFEYIPLTESPLTQDLREEINTLKSDLLLLRTTVDSLGQEHSAHKNEFDKFKNEIESMFSNLMKSDMIGSKIIIKNDEPITSDISENLVDSYRKALDDCLNYRFETAIAQFQSIINRYPNSKLTENCRYWIAQSYYSMRNYPAAIETFKAVIADTRFSHKNDDASIMLGISYYLTGNTSEALIEFQKFLINYPESEYRDKVNYWIQRLS